MVDLNQDPLLHLRELFARFGLECALSQFAGLLTVPSLQANAIRVETAVHHAVSCSRGNHRTGHEEIGRLLKTEFAGVTHTEDPAEDVFITSVTTPQGNRRVFQGIWNASDYHLQSTLYVLLSQEIPPERQKLLESAYALLKVSEEIARRMDLPRWHQETSTAQGDIQLPDAAVLRRATGAVSFSNDQLLELGIDPDLLSPFVLPKVDRALLLTQQLGNTSLERCPLVRIGENLICALPNSISPAIRRFVVEELDRAGELSAFSRALAEYQFEQVRDRMIWEFRDFSLLPNVPEPEGAYPSLHSWVINYDLDKLLHVLVIYGRLDSIKKHGFNFPTGESAAKLKGLKRYVATVANWCKSRPDCQEGTTLLVLGGLGEPSSLGLNSTVDDWHISAMNIADFRLVASEDDQPITPYLKFIKQRALVQERGVEFFFLEDFALYCHWRHTDYMLVPRPLPLEPGSVFVQLGGAIESVCEHRSRNLSTTLRHCRLLFTEQSLLLWMSRVD